MDNTPFFLFETKKIVILSFPENLKPDLYLHFKAKSAK
jgi:hypothetical protein